MAEARVDQLAVELMGIPAATARVNQLAVELLGAAASPVRVNQLAVEILGVGGFTDLRVRVDQLMVEVLGQSLFPTPFGGTRVLNPVYPTTKDFGFGPPQNQKGLP